MLIPLFNSIGSWFYEANKVLCQPEVDDLKDPDDFKPGVLFDVSASWVMLVRTLLVPEYARKRLPAPGGCLAPCGGPCPDSGGAGADGANSSSTSSRSNRCKKSRDDADGPDGRKRKKKGFSMFRC